MGETIVFWGSKSSRKVTQCQPIDGYWYFEDAMVPWNTSNCLLMGMALTTQKTYLQQHCCDNLSFIQIECLLVYEIWGCTVKIIEHIVFWDVIPHSLLGYQCVSQTFSLVHTYATATDLWFTVRCVLSAMWSTKVGRCCFV